MPDYVERVELVMGGKSLDDIINSINESEETKTNPVNTMNMAKTVRGFKQGNDMYSFDLDAERIDPASGMPDWSAMRKKRTRFDIVVVPSVGFAYTYRNCRVTKVVNKASDGDSGVTVSCVAQDKRSQAA